jgi:hypothetical protein
MFKPGFAIEDAKNRPAIDCGSKSVPQLALRKLVVRI